MSDQESVGNSELQFDRVETGPANAPSPTGTSVECRACHSTIVTEYYTVNGHVCCERCRSTLEAAAETPQGIGPLARAGLFGLGAGIAGAAIYFAVIAIAHLEIGIVAILIGYMVGYSVRKGARGRGGLRFQVLAAALTYASVAMAYTPVVVREIASRNAQNAQATVAGGGDQRAVAEATSQAAGSGKPSGARLVLAVGALLAFIAALPVMIVIGSLPFGLLSALIIFVGMRQAWRMTAAPWLDILGPYRVGATAAAST
jgi:hypothetical protein